MVGAGHGLWGASDDYSMPTFAPELAKHDPFGHARAMIGVQATLLASAAPWPFLEDPPSRSSVACQMKVLLDAIAAPRNFKNKGVPLCVLI